MAQIRKFADPGERVSTGAIRFGSDWPGIFIRGDEAIGMSLQLKFIAEKISIPECKLLERMAELLSRCKVED